MNKNILFIIEIIILIIIVGGFFLLTNQSDQQGLNQQSQSSFSDTTMVDCGNLEPKNFSCFVNRMNECLPVTAKLTGADGSRIDIVVLGKEEEKCHFQNKINGVVNFDCYFPKGTLNWDTIGQTLGDDKGLQKVIDDNCKSGGKDIVSKQRQ